MSEQGTSQNTTQKTTPIAFNGKASEYFGIWIVNLLLTLVTLGIYSAWAKVRRKKYFYNNTLIDNVGFDYHAKPIAILKGRIIAFVFFMLYGASSSIHPLLTLLLGLILFIAIPWVVVRSTIFNARNTSHRGLRFDFVGTLPQARKVFIFLPVLLIFTLGLIFPYISHQRNQFLMSNHRFGLTQFDMKSVVKQFYKVYLIFILIPLIGILAAIAIPAYQVYVNKTKAAKHVELNIPNQVLKASMVGFVPFDQDQIVLAANETGVETTKPMHKVERVYSDNAPPEQANTADVPSEISATSESVPHDEANMTVEERNFAMEEDLPMDKTTVQAAMKARQAEEAQMAAQAPPKEKTFEEIKKEQEQARKDKIRDMMRSPAAWGAMLGAALAYAFFIFGFLGYIKARVGNLVWNNTKLDKLSFKSSLRARDFIWLYFSNIIAIVCTFGLATPWAQIRMAKYRASKLQIIGDVDFDQFVGEKRDELKATGEEIADFFDIDLTFG